MDVSKDIAKKAGGVVSKIVRLVIKRVNSWAASWEKQRVLAWKEEKKGSGGRTFSRERGLI